MNFVVRCWDQTLNVLTTNPRVATYISSLGHLAGIPLAVLNNHEVQDGPWLKILEGHPTTLRFDRATRSLVLQTEWELISKSNTLENLLGQLLSLACIDNEIFPLHTASVAHDDRAYLLIGDTGAGKTILSVALCANPAFKWISNDWTGLSVVDGKVVVSTGHDLIGFTKASLPRMQDLLSKECFRQIQSRFPPEATAWTKSTPPFSGNELGLTQGTLPVTVSGLFFINIRQDIGECGQRIPRKLATTILLREFTWPLRGLGSFVLDNFGRAVCPSAVVTPSREWGQILDFVNLVISQCPAYMVHGSLETAVRIITSKTLA